MSRCPVVKKIEVNADIKYNKYNATTNDNGGILFTNIPKDAIHFYIYSKNRHDTLEYYYATLLWLGDLKVYITTNTFDNKSRVLEYDKLSSTVKFGNGQLEISGLGTLLQENTEYGLIVW